MALNVSEDQKKVIESQGYMVVEFKLWCRKLCKMILEYTEKVIDNWKAIFCLYKNMQLRHSSISRILWNSFQTNWSHIWTPWIT